MPEQKFTKNQPGQPSREISNLDEKIAELLTRRTQALARHSRKRIERKKPAADPALEKELWNLWKDGLARQKDLDPKLWKQIFVTLNSLAYTLAEHKRPADRQFKIWSLPAAPLPPLPGPTDRLFAKIAVALGAFAQKSCTVAPVMLDDHLIDLVKAANSLGAAISWEDDRLILTPASQPGFEGKTVYTGDDPLNFYLLLCLALPHPGKIAFTGGATMKLLDISFLNEILPGLGARLTLYDRKSPGLPVRLESCGDLPPSIKLPADTPAEFVVALAAAAASYRDGLVVSLPGPDWNTGAVSRIKNILGHMGVAAEVSGQDLAISPGRLQAEELSPPLDPILSAYILALARGGPGQVRIQGSPPVQSQIFDHARDLLKSAGVKTKISETGVTAASEPWPDNVELRPARPELAPLASALACVSPGPCSLFIAENHPERPVAESFLDAQERSYSTQTDRLEVEPLDKTRYMREPWHGPDPLWALALAVAAQSGTVRTLDNPGVVSEAWPRFWHFYTGLRKEKSEVRRKDVQSRRRKKIE